MNEYDVTCVLIMCNDKEIIHVFARSIRQNPINRWGGFYFIMNYKYIVLS